MPLLNENKQDTNNIYWRLERTVRPYKQRKPYCSKQTGVGRTCFKILGVLIDNLSFFQATNSWLILGVYFNTIL